MKLGLQLRLKQTLAPQLIQSLKMLQMPILKLEQTLRHELATNPLLEEVETLEAESPADSESSESTEEQESETESEQEKIDWDDYVNDFDDDWRSTASISESREDTFLATTSLDETLYDHLLEQLSLLRLSEEQHIIGEYILGNIDSSGYLVVSAQEMVTELEVPLDQIVELLGMIKKFDPVGVASRDLRESLLTQLSEKKMADTLAWRIVNEHLYDLEKKSILQIGKLMGVSFEKTQAALEIIKSLSPSPAYGRFTSGAAAIIPDLIIERVGDEYVIYHNDRSLPKLRINPAYRSLVKRGATSSKDTKKYIRQKLEQARWLLNSINQRRSTMVRVMESIIESQYEFFEKGTEYLKPLIMEDIARKVDMNVATISRVSSGKYVQTPHGVLEIKYFFNTGIARSDGGELSKRHVKRQIEDIIKGEDLQKPFSDQEIYRKLQADGIKLARRTVTKYREELKIQPARFRKRSV